MAEAAREDTIGSDFMLEIVTPERQLVSERVDSLRAPGVDGEFGVLPSHIRMMAGVGTGLLRYRSIERGDWTELAVSNGLVEVLPDRVIVLANTAETAEEIDIARAQAAFDRARNSLEHPDEDTDIEAALAALRRAATRLQAAKGQPTDS